MWRQLSISIYLCIGAYRRFHAASGGKGIVLSTTAGEIVGGKGGHTLCIPDCSDPVDEV